MLTVDEILEMNTIRQGHFDNLKYDNGNTRIWVSRMTVADGAGCNKEITVEHLINGNWQIVNTYNPTYDTCVEL